MLDEINWVSKKKKQKNKTPHSLSNNSILATREKILKHFSIIDFCFLSERLDQNYKTFEL